MKKKSAEIPHFHNDTIYNACPYCLPDREARLKESKNLKASCDHKKGIFDKDKECRKDKFKCKRVLKCMKCKETFLYSAKFLKKQKRKYKDG